MILLSHLGRITQKADEFTKSLEASNARVIAFGASAAIIGTVAKGFEQLVVQAVKFEKLLTDINVVLGTSSTNLAKFGDNLFKVARNTSQALDVAAEAALEFSRQGLSMEETLRRTNDALILTRLTGIKAADAVSGLTAAVNGFADAGLTTTSIINKLAAVDVKFAVSADDLINALARAGAVAQDAGVNFDQLVGAVTSAQQITARGGAVIGNSFKTIFTRIQRSSTLDRLQELGIAVRDIRGSTLPALTVLTNLSKTYDTLGSSTKAAVAEQVGGVFQINVLKAALKDLNRENSLYAQATQISNNATDQAQQKNAQLQQTLSSLATQTSLSIQELSANIGELALAPGIKNLLDAINNLGTGLNDLLGKNAEGVGADFGKAIVRGIGGVISGPGMVLAFGIFAKLFANALKFAKSSLKDILGIVTQKEKERQIQESIVMAMNNNKTLAEELNRMSGNKLKQEELILAVIKQQTASIQAQQNIAKSVAPGLARKGVNTDLTMNTRGRGGASSGFVPNFSSSVTPFERQKERGSAIKAGYTPGNVSDINIKGVGRVVYNTAETVKKFPGMQQPAIMPPQGSDAGQKYKYKFVEKHGFNPYSFNGFVPNFADPRTRGQKIRDTLNDPANKGIKFKNLASGKNMDFKLKSASDRRFVEIFLKQKTGDGALYLDRLKKVSGYSDSQINNLRQLKRSYQSGSPVSLDGKEVLQSGFVPNFALEALASGNVLRLPKAKMFVQTSDNKYAKGGWHNVKAQVSQLQKDKGAKQLSSQLMALEALGITTLNRPFYFTKAGDPLNKVARSASRKQKGLSGGDRSRIPGSIYEKGLQKNLSKKGYISTSRDPSANVDFLAPGRTPIEAKFNSAKANSIMAKSLKLTTDRYLENYLSSKGMTPFATSLSDTKRDLALKSAGKIWGGGGGTEVSGFNLSSGFIPSFSKQKVQAITNIIDGDSVVADVATGVQNIDHRLAGVDAVEKNQPFGTRATTIAKSFYGKRGKSRLQQKRDSSGKAAYNRGLFRDSDLAESLVVKGYGIPDRRYLNQGNYSEYAKLVKFAQQRQVGMWGKSHQDQKGNYTHNKALMYIKQNKLFDKGARSKKDLRVKSGYKGQEGYASGPRKFSGFVPNFSNPLAEAIRREREAGLSDSKIRIDQDSRLKSKDNPLGLAVTNTRDEPLGIQQGIERARAMGIDPKTHGASSGLVPNFSKTIPQVDFNNLPGVKKSTDSIKRLGNTAKGASKDVKKHGKDSSKAADSSGGLMMGMFALTSMTYALEGAIGDAESGFAKLSKITNSAVMGVSQSAMIYSGLNDIGEQQIKKGTSMGKMFGRLAKGAGIFGAIVGTAIPIFQALKENFDTFKNSTELINNALAKATQNLDNLSTTSTSLESSQINNKRIIELESKGRQRTISEDKELIKVKQSQLRTDLTLKSSLNELTKSTKLSAEQQLQLKGSYEDQVKLMNDLQSAQLRYITTLNESKYSSGRDKEAGSEGSWMKSTAQFLLPKFMEKAVGIDSPDPGEQKAEFNNAAKDFAKSFAAINIDSNVVSEDPNKLLAASRNVRGKFQDRLNRSKSDQLGGDFLGYNIKDIFKDSFKELGEAAGLKGADLNKFQSAGINRLDSRYKDFDQIGFGSEVESQAVLDQMIAIALEFENVAKESKSVKEKQAAVAKKFIDVNKAIDLGKNAWTKSALKTEIYSSIIDERISNMQRTLSFEQDYNKLLSQQFINSNTTTNLNKAIEATQTSYMSKISKIEEERLSAERDFNLARAKQIEKLLKDGDGTMVKLGKEGDKNALMGPDSKVKTSKLRITKPKQIESQDGELRDTNEMETSIMYQVTKEIQSRVKSVQNKEGIVSGEHIGAIIKDATSNTSEQFLNQGATQDEITNAMMVVLEAYKEKGFLASRGNKVENGVSQSLGEAKRILDQKNSSLAKQEKNAKDLQSKEEQIAKEKEGELAAHRKNMADLSARSGELKSTEIKNLSASNNVLEKNLKLLEIKGSIYNTEEGIIELARSEVLERGKSIEIQKQRNNKLFALLSNEEALVKITDKEISEKLRGDYGSLSTDRSTHEGMSKPQNVEDSPYSGMTGYQQKSMVAAEKEFTARQKLISMHEANIESGFYLEQAFTGITTAGSNFTAEMIKARAKLSSGESFNEGVRSVEQDQVSSAQGLQKAQGKVAATQGNSITNSRAMVELTEAQRELNIQQNAGTLFADSMAVKMAEANKELAMFGQTLAETSFDAMRDGFRGLFDDLIDGSKSTGDAALNFFAGIAKKIQDKLLDRASTQLAVGFSDMLGLDDIGRNNSGGLIRGYAKGGTVGGGKVPSMLTAGEYVVKKKIVDRLGSGTLDSINKTGSLDELYNKPNEDIFDITTEGAATIPPIMRFQDGGNVASYLTQRNMGYDRVSENERSTVNGEVVNDFTNALDSVFQKHNKQNVAGKHEKSYSSTYNNSDISNSIQHYNNGGGVMEKALKGGSGKSGLQNAAEGGGYMLGSYLGASQEPGEPPKAPEAPKNQRLNTRSGLNLDAAGADRSKMSQRFIANDSYTKEMKKYHLDMYEFSVQQRNEQIKERAEKIATIAGTAAIAGGMALGQGAVKMYEDYKHNQNMKHIDNAYTQMNIDNGTASSMFGKSIGDTNKTLSLDYHTDVSSLKNNTIYGDNHLSANTRNYKNSSFSDTMNNLSSSKSISGGHYSSSSAFSKNYNSSSMSNSSKNSFASTEMENYLSSYDQSNKFSNTSNLFRHEGEFNKGGVVNNKTIKPYSYYNKGGSVNVSNNPYSYFNKGGSVNNVSSNPYSYFNRGGSVNNISSNPYSYFNRGGSVNNAYSNPYSYFNRGGNVSVSNNPYSYFNQGGSVNNAYSNPYSYFNRGGNVSVSNNPYSYLNKGGSVYSNHSSPYSYFNSGGSVNNVSNSNIQKFSGGGKVNGPGGIDKVGPVLLDKGEYVIKASSVNKVEKKYPGFFDKLNSSKMKDGGKVGAESAINNTTSNIENSKSSDNNSVVVNINISSNGSTSVDGGSDGQQAFASKIKDAVTGIISQEKRVGGMLRGK